MSVFVRAIVDALHRLRRERSGVALVEFAIVVPVLIVLYFGAIEITQTVTARRKLNLVAQTAADLTARNETVGQSTLKDIFGAASTIMTPVDTSNLSIRISSVIVSPLGTTCVDWSVVSGTGLTALKPGNTYDNIPTDLKTISLTTLNYKDYIVVSTTFPFRPATHQFIPGSIQLSEGPTYLVPRKSDQVKADSTIASKPCAFS